MKWQKFTFHPCWNYSSKKYWPPRERVQVSRALFFPLAVGVWHFSRQIGTKSSNHFNRDGFFLWYCSSLALTVGSWCLHITLTSCCCGTWSARAWDLQSTPPCSHSGSAAYQQCGSFASHSISSTAKYRDKNALQSSFHFFHISVR